MHPTPLLLFGLRQGLCTLDSVLAAVRVAPPWERDLWNLSPGLDDAELTALQRALAAAHQQYGALRTEWIKRGRLNLARAEPEGVEPFVIEQALHSAEGKERDAWIALARTSLERVWRDEKQSVLQRTMIARFALQFAESADIEPRVRELCAGFEREVEAGLYTRIDIAYAELDPALYLARTCASVGFDADAARVLDERESRHTAFLQEGEVAEVVRLVADAREAARSAYRERFSRWARATRDMGEGEGVCEATWFLSQRDGAAEEALSRLVAKAEMAEVLLVITRVPGATAALREATRVKLADLAHGYIETLREVTRDGKVSDAARRATAVRQLRAAAGALAESKSPMEPLLAARVTELAQTWSSWVVTQNVSGDSLPHVCTGIAFAKLAPEAMRPAAEQLCALDYYGVPLVLRYEGWSHLYPHELAMQVARKALA